MARASTAFPHSRSRLPFRLGHPLASLHVACPHTSPGVSWARLGPSLRQEKHKQECDEPMKSKPGRQCNGGSEACDCQ